MHADPALTEPYVPPGAVFKFSLVLALAAGGALIVPVHYLTPRKADGTEKREDLSDVVHFVPVQPKRSTDSVQLASASQSLDPLPILAAIPTEPMPFEPMPLEPMPLDPMPIEPMPIASSTVEASPFEAVPIEASEFEPTPVASSLEPAAPEALAAVEETPWYLEQAPAIEAAPTAIEPAPTAEETYVLQDQPPALPVESDYSLPPSPATDAPPEAPLFAVAQQPTESPSDAPPVPQPAPAPMPAVDIDAMPMPAPAVAGVQEPAPVVEAPTIDVVTIEKRSITCTSPVPEPVAFSPLKPTMQSLPQTQPGVQPMPQATRQPYAQPTARPAYQQPRPSAPQPQQLRQSFNHPGYGTYNR